jgi:predicted Zn-dependent peptidase
LFGDWSGDAFESLAPRMHGGTYAHITQDTAQEQIGMMIPDASASLEPEQWGWYESRLALGILSGGGFSSRLMQEVREKRGLVYSVSASGAQVRGGGYVTAYAGTTPDRAQETVDVMLEEFNKMSLGVSTDELERSRVSLLTSLVMSEESSGARARSLARDQVLLGRIRNLEDIKKGIQNVTLESVNRWLAQYPFQAPAIMTLGPKALEMTKEKTKEEREQQRQKT